METHGLEDDNYIIEAGIRISVGGDHDCLIKKFGDSKFSQVFVTFRVFRRWSQCG